MIVSCYSKERLMNGLFLAFEIGLMREELPERPCKLGLKFGKDGVLVVAGDHL